MNISRILWGVVATFVIATVVVTFGPSAGHSQQGTEPSWQRPTPIPGSREDLNKYAIVNYDEPDPVNGVDREERRRKNERYDERHWVLKNPNPKTDGVGLFDEIPPPTAIPVIESALVVVGEVTSVSAYLSNDKTGVYSEFKVRVDEVLKNDNLKSVASQDCIVMDREGGAVKYPNGKKVIYRNSVKDLPFVGGRYVLFLRKDNKSPNYEILTGYELRGAKVEPLDNEISFSEFSNVSKLDFIKTIRSKISESTQPSKQ